MRGSSRTPFHTSRFAIFDARFQPHAVPHVEVLSSRSVRDRNLLAGDFVLSAIHDRPQRLACAREAAREHAGLQCLLVRRPVHADHQRRELPLNRRDPPQRFGVARRELIPDAPHVLPRGVTDPIEEHVLQIVVAVAAPAVLDVHDVARLEPLELEHRRNRFLRDLLAPALHVPIQNVIAGLRGGLRLQHDSRPTLRTRIEECARHAAVGIAVDAVRTDRRDQLRHQFPVGLAVRPRAVVPRHRRQKHLHAALVEISDCALEAGDAPWQIVRHVEMVAIIDADVRVDVPQQHAVDAAVTTLQVVEIALHGVAPRDRIEQVTILDHRQRLHEIALRPLQARIAIQRVVVTQPHEMLVSPLAQAADPVFAVRVDVDHPVTDAGEWPTRRRARQRQVRPGQRVRELEAGSRSHHERNDRTPQY
jgi:hypothetical protein